MPSNRNTKIEIRARALHRGTSYLEARRQHGDQPTLPVVAFRGEFGGDGDPLAQQMARAWALDGGRVLVVDREDGSTAEAFAPAWTLPALVQEAGTQLDVPRLVEQFESGGSLWQVSLPWVLGCDAGAPFSDFARQVAADEFPFVVTTSRGDDAFDVVHAGLAEVYIGAVEHPRIKRRQTVVRLEGGTPVRYERDVSPLEAATLVRARHLENMVHLRPLLGVVLTHRRPQQCPPPDDYLAEVYRHLADSGTPVLGQVYAEDPADAAASARRMTAVARQLADALAPRSRTAPRMD